MIRTLFSRLRQFRKDDKGTMTIEFMLFIPLMITVFLTSVELGIYQMRQMFLDRGMDMAVRDVRLNTGTNYSHSTLKGMICNYSGFLENCDVQLKLEMTQVDLRGFTGDLGRADCSDASQPVKPNRTFKHGVQHEMMILRACYKFKPVFKSSGLGYNFATEGDGAGMARMIAASAFVQEP